MDELEICVNCRFFIPNPKPEKAGVCMRYPPIASNSPTRRPAVMPTEWCGEFTKNAAEGME